MYTVNNVVDDSIFMELREAVRNGTAPEKFPVGMELPNIWTDVSCCKAYDMPWIIADYRMLSIMQNSDLNEWHILRSRASDFIMDVTSINNYRLAMSAILISKYVLPRPMQFCVNVKRGPGRMMYRESAVRNYLRYEYLMGCSQSLCDAIAARKIVDWKEELYEVFFLPSYHEIAPITKNYIKDNSETWQYFRNPQENRIFKCPDGALSSCWTRTISEWIMVCCLSEKGNAAGFHSRYADDSCGILPACVIA